MTDFLAWWADHWPLVPILALYPWYAMWVLDRWVKLKERIGARMIFGKRRREP